MAKLIVPGPFKDDYIIDIKTRFEKLLDKPVSFEIEIDASIIGGFIAFIDGKIYDASIKTRLNEIRKNLK